MPWLLAYPTEGRGRKEKEKERKGKGRDEEGRKLLYPVGHVLGRQDASRRHSTAWPGVAHAEGGLRGGIIGLPLAHGGWGKR